MTRNIQGPLVLDQLRVRDLKGTFQLGMQADLILVEQIDAPNAGSPGRPAFVGPLATMPVYWTVTGRLRTERTPGRNKASESLSAQ
jgi:hypothetical protein